jgi:hypothetical protein
MMAELRAETLSFHNTVAVSEVLTSKINSENESNCASHTCLYLSHLYIFIYIYLNTEQNINFLVVQYTK